MKSQAIRKGGGDDKHKRMERWHLSYLYRILLRWTSSNEIRPLACCPPKTEARTDVFRQRNSKDNI